MTAHSRERIVTPIGIARYAWLRDPDTKFNASGVWRTQLIAPASECTAITQRLDELVDESYKAACRKVGAGRMKTIIRHPAYFQETDMDGVATGNIILKLKKNTTFIGRNGETLTAKLPAFDAKGQPILEVPSVYSGSSLRVNFTPLPYFVEAHKTAGVGLWLNSFQIVNLVSAARDAASYGYTEEDGDYVYEEEVAADAKDVANTEAKLRAELKSLCEVAAGVEGKDASEVLGELAGGITSFNAIPFLEKENGKTISPLTMVWEKAMRRVDSLKDPVEVPSRRKTKSDPDVPW